MSEFDSISNPTIWSGHFLGDLCELKSASQPKRNVKKVYQIYIYIQAKIREQTFSTRWKSQVLINVHKNLAMAPGQPVYNAHYRRLDKQEGRV